VRNFHSLLWFSLRPYKLYLHALFAFSMSVI
jgi:hypothetical protein